MSDKKLILVTGASGSFGAQAVDHLLKAGYAVRGTSRSGKADQLAKNIAHPDFEVVVVNDVIAGDFSVALRGVYSIVHAASPLAGKGGPTELLNATIEGAMNLLRQAHAAKIYKFCLISSLYAMISKVSDMLDPSLTFTEKDWGDITKERALAPDTSPMEVYLISKGLAERAAWDFVDNHPEMDLTCLCPSFMYGPLAPGQVVLDPTRDLATNHWVYMLVAGANSAFPPFYGPQSIDIRDVAKATVLAIELPRAKAGERKRVPLVAWSFTWNQAIRHLGSVRPDIKSRILREGNPPAEAELPAAKVDMSKAKELLGLEDFIGWEKAVDDGVDSLLKREPSWMN